MVPLFNNYIANNMEGRGHFHAKICFARGRVWPFKMVNLKKKKVFFIAGGNENKKLQQLREKQMDGSLTF